MGKLPKMNFPRFNGENPKLWQSHCDNYFEMYAVESCVWVMRISLCTWSLWGWFFLSISDYSVRIASWTAFRAVRTAASWLFLGQQLASRTASSLAS
jgi:hypothetical protein